MMFSVKLVIDKVVENFMI